MEEEEEQKRRGVGLVLFPCPLQGHINPMLQLASILHSKGFSIIIVHTRFNSPNSSNYPHFNFIPIPDGISDIQASFSDVLALLSHLNVNCAVPLRDCLVRLLSDHDNSISTSKEKEPISCLISDAIMHFTQGVADGLKLPRLVLRTSSVESFLAFAAFPVLRQKNYLPISDSELETPVTELPPLKVKDLPVIKTHDLKTLYQLVGSMVDQVKASSGLILNTFDHLEQSSLSALTQEFPIPVFTIGPFHKLFPASSSSLLTQDQSCIAWLDTQPPKSVIYVSFGSLASMDEAEFMEMAWGLANSKCPFLWVVRSGLVHDSDRVEPLWPDGFLEMISGKGCIVKWAPQQDVLAHPAVGGFWTHNGWNSTLESICEGVPMLCHPNFGDQMVNARYVSHVWRVGLHLENRLERKEIERNIRRLMVEKEGEDMRERVASLKEKAEASVKKGGSSYESLEELIAQIFSF
ncbi:UDP-glycosyltransferase 76B1-like isoform X1 [Telopea speciosissima]|uniref:UDP-glycosyltransferase 76B1-like isoform X1 n=1 Tax=Telopea speciosissima TaxID=54955 RepID=UPI001CC48D5B|nr:UDP-glycosyltransferase 76B1-like isoform X1 [Telopea speciosissima]